MMTKKILIGASVLAFSMLGASGAWANPENIFSDYGENCVYSTAYTVIGNALSESFNTNQNSISYQDLYAYSDGNEVYGGYYGGGSVNSGSATVSGGNTTSGISAVSANSGNGSVVQQGVSLAALGTVNVQ